MTNDKQLKVQAHLNVVAMIFVVVLLFAGCNSDDPPPSEPKRMRIEEAPENMLANIDTTYKFVVVIEGDDAAADSIACAINPANRRVVLSCALWDDGSLQSLWGPDFAGTVSGDIIPHDRKFTRFINGMELSDNGTDTGSYRFEFQPVGNFTIGAPLSVTIPVESVANCVIRSAKSINTFAECHPDSEARATVIADAPDVIDSVRFQILDGNTVLAQTELVRVSGDSVWSAQITPALIRCIPTGNGYSYAYLAKTRFGLTCTNGDSLIAIFNHLPVLSNSTLPDTIYRPTDSSRTDTVLVTVSLDDCELLGATDFYGLQFDYYRDSNPWFHHRDFYLRDDGVPADVVAGDGVFSIGLTFIRNDTLPDNLYYFRFYAIEGFLNDCVPFDTSAYLLDSVRVIQPHALVGGGTVSGGADFGIAQGNGRR